MPCSGSARRHVAVIAGSIIALLGLARTSSAQQPATPVTPPAPYHAPAFILAQPNDGGAIPADRPIVVFRFTQGEPTDPLDALSFIVAVDGKDRTDRFQMTNGEAWGPIDGPSASAAATHDLRARICSTRGTCATVHATVSTTPVDALAMPTVRASASKSAPKQRARSAIQTIDRVLQAATVLVRP